MYVVYAINNSVQSPKDFLQLYAVLKWRSDGTLQNSHNPNRMILDEDIAYQGHLTKS